MARARGRGKYSSTLQSGAVNLILVFLIVRDRAIQILLSVSFFWGGETLTMLLNIFCQRKTQVDLRIILLSHVLILPLVFTVFFWGGD